jgi:hypothetical protein
MAGCTLFAFGPYSKALDGLSDWHGFEGVPEGHPVLVEVAHAPTRGQAEALAAALGLNLSARAGWTAPARTLPFLEQALEAILPHDAEDIVRDIEILANAGMTLAYRPE